MNDYIQDKKERVICIIKDELYKDIDALTFKFAEASSVPQPKVENAMSSDSTEDLDGHILSRNIEFRDAKLRQLLSFAIADDVGVHVADDEQTLDKKIIYKFILDATFKDSLLKAVATYIHRYLVYGALFDWYGAGMGMQQSREYERQLTDLENEITNNLRSTNVVKRPMQPFGPKKRYF